MSQSSRTIQPAYVQCHHPGYLKATRYHQDSSADAPSPDAFSSPRADLQSTPPPVFPHTSLPESRPGSSEAPGGRPRCFQPDPHPPKCVPFSQTVLSRCARPLPYRPLCRQNPGHPIPAYVFSKIPASSARPPDRNGKVPPRCRKALLPPAQNICHPSRDLRPPS